DEFVINDFYNYFKPTFSWLTSKDVEKAYLKAKLELNKFKKSLYNLYNEALQTIDSSNREGIIIVGRPYNVNDSGINLNLASKLRDLYGINVLPLDLIELMDDNIDEINQNMFWGYGRKILATLKQIRSNKKLNIIYVTNFQCGPDSYIKHFAPTALGKSYLTLQFDGHGNDAGMLTRCEAYLDSKGVFNLPVVSSATVTPVKKPIKKTIKEISRSAEL
ncbi:MAG: acyl-CoA dehydratase activase-related protein, partial [bacterium]